jgi:hypothetical protein
MSRAMMTAAAPRCAASGLTRVRSLSRRNRRSSSSEGAWGSDLLGPRLMLMIVTPLLMLELVRGGGAQCLQIREVQPSALLSRKWHENGQRMITNSLGRSSPRIRSSTPPAIRHRNLIFCPEMICCLPNFIRIPRGIWRTCDRRWRNQCFG